MNLRRKIALVLMIGAVTACHDTSATGIPASYALTAINGNQLPASYSGIPTGSTVVSGALILDGAGLAVFLEERRDANGVQSTVTTKYRYTIKDNVIEFDYPSCRQAPCISLPKGTLADDHALIDFSSGQGRQIFDYMLGGDI
ncbi:MAG: hypothetical protein ACJ8AK_03390 [Gemmatimonadaceae bacterium]